MAQRLRATYFFLLFFLTRVDENGTNIFEKIFFKAYLLHCILTRSFHRSLFKCIVDKGLDKPSNIAMFSITSKTLEKTNKLE